MSNHDSTREGRQLVLVVDPYNPTLKVVPQNLWLGALMYYYIFYQTKLVPRWLSGWGLVGITLLIATIMLVMFRIITPLSTFQIILALPMAVQETVLAVWLIVKGFNSSATGVGLSLPEKVKS